MKTNIQPAKGKLGILIPGLGAVATTMIAGVEANRFTYPNGYHTFRKKNGEP
jgi:myo-inositol-1-phosphate synthase